MCCGGRRLCHRFGIANTLGIGYECGGWEKGILC